MGAWEGFFVAEAGASAALAGLIFVGVSINLEKIMITSGLPGRAFETLLLLQNVLVLSSVSLVPEQSVTALGLEVLAIGLAVWIYTVASQASYGRKLEAQYRGYFIRNVALTQVALLPFLIAAVVLLFDGNTYDGVYWVVPGMVFSFVVAIINVWVLLVEINR